MSHENQLTATVNFLHEVGQLAQTPRSGFAFLGSGKQSVAEHSYRMALVAFALADLIKDEAQVDRNKMVTMCLLHDLPEARISDLNYVNKRYVQVDEQKAIEEIRSAYPVGEEIAQLLKEYEEEKTLEAKLVHDADQLEMILTLKKEVELGNAFATLWMENAAKRIQTDVGKKLAQTIPTVKSYTWWSGIS